MANVTAQDFYTGMIAQVANADKFLEFLDGMVPAFEKDYGMIQGAIGKDHAANSGIRIVITDHSGGKVTGKATALVPTWVFDQIRDSCLKNTGTPVLSGGVFADLASSLSRFLAGFKVLLKEIKGAIAKIIEKKEEQPLAAVGKAVRTALYKTGGFNEDKTIDLTAQNFEGAPLGVNVDYCYRQVRVNPAAKAADGTVSCSNLTICRMTAGKDAAGNGVVYKLPWKVSISNFSAKPNRHQNGTVSYDPKTVVRGTDCSFSLSNDDMFRCAYAVEHFVSQWERANLGGFIAGLNETQRRREEHLSSLANR